MSLIDAEAVNTARMSYAIARCAKEEIARLEDELNSLLKMADFGCANDPLGDRVPMNGSLLSRKRAPSSPARAAIQKLPLRILQGGRS